MAKRYPKALRERIILEFRQGRSIQALANDYEPCEATIRQWVEREFGGGRLDESEADEPKRLRKENQQLREDKLILEKAAAWFATHRNER